MTKGAVLALEDELGDVLDKAVRQSGITHDLLALRAEVPLGRILDAIDYRSDLSCDELRRIAGVLHLNEVGLCALGAGNYPLPAIGGLPFCVWPLAMPHGIGVVNAYLVGECGSSRAILFDTGAGMAALDAVWPDEIRHLDAVFLTHVEAEHAGGLSEVLSRYRVPAAYVPVGATASGAQSMGEGATVSFRHLEVTAYTTPGHAAAHNCYLVRAPRAVRGTTLLISGDLVFAGSVGGAHFSPLQLQESLRRMLSAVPLRTVIAPGHGPLTTVENELRYNPFAS